MTKIMVALASVLLLSASAATAAESASSEKAAKAEKAKWAAFKTLDTDGSGRISRPEWEKNVGKLGLDPAPAFTAMDTDNNNGIDENEWAAAEKLTAGYSERCNKADSSWCKELK